MSYMDRLEDFLTEMVEAYPTTEQDVFERVLAHVRNGNSHPIETIRAELKQHFMLEAV